MRLLDWIVLAATLVFIVLYGLWKGRGSRTMSGYLLADRSMKWYTIALSIMATQASAITFTSTPGQAYADGMRFVQFYLGLPIAMVILSVTAVPIFHRLKVFTAYEYLENRFDVKTRILTTLIFLVSRGLAAGMTIYAPSLVLSVMLGLDIRVTSLIIGGVVIIYTASGGVRAVNHTDVFQLAIVMGGMVLAFALAIHLLPSDVSFVDALSVSAVMGRLNTIDLTLDFSNRYNLWSGLIGGMFVALAYFGTDQSQVQRYLTGKSIAHSRLALLFNGLVKVPMQFFILLIGVAVFAFYQFVQPPLYFNPAELEHARSGVNASHIEQLESDQRRVFDEKLGTVREYLEARRHGTPESIAAKKEMLQAAQRRADALHAEAVRVVASEAGSVGANETNYVFLSFVLRYLPAGVVGLIFACIFLASMSSSAGELSALATISVVDIYSRLLQRTRNERRDMLVSRVMMVFWGLYGIAFAQFAGRMGSLVEAVNILGSLFYGTMLGVFLLAFYFKSVGGTGAFIGAVVGEAIVLCCFQFTSIAWLWYNVVGCLAVVSVGWIWARMTSGKIGGGALPA